MLTEANNRYLGALAGTAASATDVPFVLPVTQLAWCFVHHDHGKNNLLTGKSWLKTGGDNVGRRTAKCLPYPVAFAISVA